MKSAFELGIEDGLVEKQASSAFDRLDEIERKLDDRKLMGPGMVLGGAGGGLSAAMAGGSRLQTLLGMGLGATIGHYGSTKTPIARTATAAGALVAPYALTKLWNSLKPRAEEEKKAAALPSYLSASKNPMLPRLYEAARETTPRKTYDFSGAVSKLVRQMQRPTQQPTQTIPMPGPSKRSA